MNRKLRGKYRHISNSVTNDQRQRLFPEKVDAGLRHTHLDQQRIGRAGERIKQQDPRKRDSNHRRYIGEQIQPRKKPCPLNDLFNSSAANNPNISAPMVPNTV